MSKAWRKGSTRAHRRARALVLANNAATNNGRCTLQIPGVCTSTADQAHHTLGKAITGDDPRYMVAACAACNQHVGDPTAYDPPPTPRTRWNMTEPEDAEP